MQHGTLSWMTSLVALALVACSGDETTAGAPPGSGATGGAGGEGGYAAGGFGGGAGGTGGTGGGGGVIGSSAFPKVASHQWGWASPAWLAEFDWVLMPWSASPGIAAKDINPDLLVTTTRETNACKDYLGGADCPVEWRVKDASGAYVNSYGSDYLADTTDHCGTSAEYGGLTFRQYVVQQAVAADWNNLDGWYSQGCWADVSWHAAIDIDGDQDSDGTDAELWKQGRLKLLAELRESLPDDVTITFNGGGAQDYWGEGPTYLNGVMAEKFMVYSDWDRVVDTYRLYAEQGQPPLTFFINNSHSSDGSAGSGSKENFRNMRFGLATALLFDGYYSYEDGDGADNEHNRSAYYDEFDVPLGNPLAGSFEIRDDVYGRFFAGGAMLLNGAEQDEEIAEADLQAAAAALGLDWGTIAGEGGHYYRFSGQQNPTFNDGSPFTSIVLPSEPRASGRRFGDGILLVRQPAQPVVAPIILDHETLCRSPGTDEAVFEGFAGLVGDGEGFRTGRYGWGVYGEGYATASPGGSPTATFSVSLAHEGWYRVLEYHPEVDGYDVLFTVHHADGQDAVTVDQRVDDEQWNELGVYRYEPGTPAQVVMTIATAQGSLVAADAIRFEWLGTQQP